MEHIHVLTGWKAGKVHHRRRDHARLTPPNYEKIGMTSTFEASYGGSEANIALARPTWAWTVPFSPWFPTTAWERAPSVC